jgi:hypothetical protein
MHHPDFVMEARELVSEGTCPKWIHKAPELSIILKGDVRAPKSIVIAVDSLGVLELYLRTESHITEPRTFQAG